MGYEKYTDDGYIYLSSTTKDGGTNTDIFEIFYIGNENTDTGQLAKYTDAPNITYAEPLPDWIKSITFNSTGDGTAGKITVVTTGYELDGVFGTNYDSEDNIRMYEFKLKNTNGIVSDNSIILVHGCISYYLALIICYPTEPVSNSLIYCGTYATDTAIFKTPILSNNYITLSDCENSALLASSTNNVWFLRYKDTGGEEHSLCYYSLFSNVGTNDNETFKSSMNNNVIDISLHKDQFNITTYPTGYNILIYKYLTIQKHTYEKIIRPTETDIINAVDKHYQLNNYEVIYDYYCNNVSNLDNVDVKTTYSPNTYNKWFGNLTNSVRWFISTYWEGDILSEG